MFPATLHDATAVLPPVLVTQLQSHAQVGESGLLEYA
jgi:hypothetical protein